MLLLVPDSLVNPRQVRRHSNIHGVLVGSATTVGHDGQHAHDYKLRPVALSVIPQHEGTAVVPSAGTGAVGAGCAHQDGGVERHLDIAGRHPVHKPFPLQSALVLCKMPSNSVSLKATEKRHRGTGIESRGHEKGRPAK